MSRARKALRQILRLPDERLRFASYGGHAGARRLWRNRESEDADLVILNTCHIREKAAEKVYSELGRVREMKEAAAAQGRHMPIAVAGCVAQAEGKEIIRARRCGRSGGRPAKLSPPARSCSRARKRGEQSSTPNFRSKTNSTLWPRPDAKPSPRGITAFVTVQEGCDKFCTFCVVPYTRGAEISRPVEKIVAEVERLADAGVREVTLIGQNVNAYHGDGPDGAPWTLGECCIASREVPGIAAPALHHQPSARRGRRPDRGASRHAGADAPCASAGAVGFRPHSGGHEPQAYARGLS